MGGRQRDTPGYKVYLMGKGIVEDRERERGEGGKGKGGGRVNSYLFRRRRDREKGDGEKAGDQLASAGRGNWR